MSINSKILVAVFIGCVIGAGGISLFNTATKHDDIIAESEDKALYWVAPMDANYRRDKPGQSPMGMDLIPVYAENTDSNDTVEGAVTIAPHVINNLGVRTEFAEFKPLNSTIMTVGYVQYAEDKLVHIHPRVEGWIDTLFLKAEGDPVIKDQAIYTLYSPELVNAQEELLIAQKRNNTSLIKAAKERLSALQVPSKFIQQLERTKQVKQTITFYAPQSGVVEKLNIREGFYVTPSKTLMSIGQLEHVWVEADVFERDSAFIKAGLPVSMTLEYLPGESWSGVVDYVYPSLNPKTRTLRVRIKFDNANMMLKPNMFAKVLIQLESSNTVIVPKGSVIRTGSQDRVVLALGEGQFKSIEVTIGRVDNDSIEILKGIVEGDKVVTSAQFLLDSESSKTSDFKRMMPALHSMPSTMANDQNIDHSHH